MPGNIAQSLTFCIVTGYAVDLFAQSFDLFFDSLPLLPQPIDKSPHTRRQLLLSIFQQVAICFHM
jgi:hypothetical protein